MLARSVHLTPAVDRVTVKSIDGDLPPQQQLHRQLDGRDSALRSRVSPLFGYIGDCSKASTLFIVWRHLVVNIADQRYPHLCRVVASQHVADKVCLNLHVHLYLR